MKRTITLFEMFSGIGSSYLALKNVYKHTTCDVLSLGSCDFYIDAIISYMIIHYGVLEPEENLSKQEMVDILNQYSFSANAKDVVKPNYFKRLNINKLKAIFVYLYSYVNPTYFKLKYPNVKYPHLTNHTDITTFSKLPKDIDILTYSFPCQDLSQQGKQKGLGESTRSGLLYQIERILKSNQDRLPKILLLENVKGLVSKKFINDFNKWIETLDNLGYSSKYAILNATDYGSSQNRERVFMLSILKTENKDITFPPTKPSTKSTNLEDIINNPYANNNLEHLLKYKHTDFKTTSFNITKAKLINYSNFNSESYIYKPINKGATLTASGANSRLKFYFQQENIIRYINEIEAYLYMGFSENDVLKIKSTNLITPTKMIFCAGNSICIQVLEAIFKEIKNYFIKDELS